MWEGQSLQAQSRFAEVMATSTGGDDGTLHGRFYGSRQGVAGTVERADLTAAFGARR